MATIYELKKRAKELAAVSETNTVDPARVGNLIDDTLELIDEYDKNVVSLGIRKTYATVAAMEADKSPSGDDGKKLRFGQLVSVYDIGNAAAVDNGKVFAWQNPGWKLSSRVDAGYARSEKVAELGSEFRNRYQHLPTTLHRGFGIGVDGMVYESVNFDNVTISVQPGSYILATLPFQQVDGLFSIAYYDNDVFVSSEQLERGSVRDEYKTLPLYRKILRVPANCNKVKATVLAAEGERGDRYSVFQYITDIPSIKIVGMGVSAGTAGVSKDGDVFFNTDTQTFMERVTGDIFVDGVCTENTVVRFGDEVYTIQDLISENPFLKKGDVDNRYIDYSNERLTDFCYIKSTNGMFYEGAKTMACTERYLYCKGSRCVRVSVPVHNISSDGVQGIAFYNKKRQFISGETRPVMTEIASMITEYETPEDASYFKTTYYNAENRVLYGDFSCFVMYDEAEYDEVELDGREICDFYGLVAAYQEDSGRNIGDMYESGVLGASSYINCKGVNKIEISMLVLTTEPSQGLVFYDMNKRPINGVLRLIGSKDGRRVVTIRIPDKAVWFKTTYWSHEKSKSHGDFYCKLRYRKGVLGDNKKRPYQDELIFFSEVINQTTNKYWDNVNEITTAENSKGTTGVLLLPDNYSPNGKACPVIMYCHGHSHYVYYGHWGSTEPFLLQKKRWASMGYAVFDCNGARNNEKQPYFTGAGSIQFVTAYKKCFDYIKKHYNVEDRVNVVGGSAGGPTAINFCFSYGNLVKKAVLLSPWTDLFTCSWEQGVRNTFVEYLGFTNAVDYEKDKTIGYDPALRIVKTGEIETIPFFPVALKCWIGSTESDHVLYSALYRFVKALRNGGYLAFIREVEGLTHDEVVSGNNEVIDTEVASWFSL